MKDKGENIKKKSRRKLARACAVYLKNEEFLIGFIFECK